MSVDKNTPVDKNISIENLITDHIDIWTSAIKRKSSSGRGSSKKIELYGIKKLRELILELAVRGKLVPQDPNDEPASVLLERIAEEKDLLIKEGKIKKPKKLPEITEEEKPFELPEGWEWSCLGELAEIGPRNTDVKDDSLASFVPMPLISTSYKGSHGTEVRKWKEIKKGYTHFIDGDIALAKITPCFENSKAAIFTGLENGIGAGTTELHVARPLPNTLNPLFILLYLKAPMFLKTGESKMTGSAGQKRVPSSFFVNNPLPFAPIEEQHRIVAKVDELMALCDELEAQTESSLEAHQTLVTVLLDTLVNSQDADELAENWARLSDHFDTLFTTEHSIDQLKQTILQLAVMGKLVPQNPNDEPASVLLERIAAEKEQLLSNQGKDKKIKKQKPLLPIADDEKPFQLPKGWEWCRLGSLGYDMGGGTPSKSNSEYWNGDIPWVSPKDMKRDFIDSSIDYVSNKAVENSTVNLIPENSLLMVVRGMILAHSFPVSITRKPVVINQDMKALVFNYLEPKFILLMMKGFKTQIVGLVDRSSHGTCKLVSSKLWSRVFIIPPLEEQHRIVAKVDELMALCDQLKIRLNDAQTTQLQLADALVEQAL